MLFQNLIKKSSQKTREKTDITLTFTANLHLREIIFYREECTKKSQYNTQILDPMDSLVKNNENQFSSGAITQVLLKIGMHPSWKKPIEHCK